MLKKLACLLALIASPLFAQQTPQAIPLTSGACKLDGTVGCGAGGGGGSGTVTSVAISGGTTGFSFSGSPITTSGTFTLSGTLAIANGGTNLTTYTLGDTLYASAANTLAKLAGNTTTTKKFLMQVGDGVNSAAPTWTATAADFPTLNQSTTGNAATATALAANPTDCSAGQYANAIAASGNLTCGAVAYSEVTGTPAAGANTALSNLASVAINTALLTGAGTAAQLTATPPAAIATSQAGIAAGMNASDAVAGSSTAGAAAGGSIALNAGAAARLTSGNANGGDIVATGGAGIGTGTRGTFQAPGAGGASTTAIGSTAVASTSGSIAVGSAASATGPSNSIAIGGATAASGAYGIAIGASSQTAVHHGIAIGAYVNASAANSFVAGASTSLFSTNWSVTDVYFGSGITDTATAASVTYHGTGGSGSNQSGGDVAMAGGISTGTAAGGAVRLRTSYPIASGSTAQTLSTRYFSPSKFTDLTETTDTAIATLTFGASSVVGGEFLVTVKANDATDFQSVTYRVVVNSVRKATGNTVSSVAATADATAAVSAGTLTCSFTVTEGASAAVLNANCTSSLTQTTLAASWQSLTNGSGLTLAQN